MRLSPAPVNKPMEFQEAWSTSRQPDALKYVREHLRQKKGVVDAVAIFDIDETLIHNHPDHNSDAFAEHTAGTTMVKMARDLGARVHAVTARWSTASARDYARRHLDTVGVRPDGEILMTLAPDVDDPTPARFKRDARAHVGGTVVLNAGDQLTDHLAPGDTLAQPITSDRYYGLVTPVCPALLSVKFPE